MGTWGPGLYSDDVACDVKEYYMNCLRAEKKQKPQQCHILKMNYLTAMTDR